MYIQQEKLADQHQLRRRSRPLPTAEMMRQEYQRGPRFESSTLQADRVRPADFRILHPPVAGRLMLAVLTQAGKPTSSYSLHSS